MAEGAVPLRGLGWLAITVGIVLAAGALVPAPWPRGGSAAVSRPNLARVASGGRSGANETIQLWEYVPLNSSVPGLGRFVGADELHMTALHCAGAPLANRTCLYRNLYYDGNSGVRQTPVFVLFAAVSDPAEATPELEARLAAQAAVRLVSYYTKDDGWSIKVALFHRARSAGRVPRVAVGPAAADAAGGVGGGAAQAAAGAAGGPGAWPPPPAPFNGSDPRPQPLVVPSVAATALSDEWVQASPAGADGDAAGLPHACVFEPAAAAAQAAGAACLPAGVSATVTRPVFYLTRRFHRHIGHSMWDDAVPWFGAVVDLGLAGRHNDMQFLVADLPNEQPPPGFDEDEEHNVAVQIYQGLAHTYRRVMFWKLQTVAQGRLVHFRSLAAGLYRRGTHALHVNYTAYGVPGWRMPWEFRAHYVAGLRAQHLDNDWTRSEVRNPHVTIVQKRGKRVIVDLPAVVAVLQREFPHAAFEVLSWEDVGSHRNEAVKLMSTHVLVSVDGTGADNLFLLPPGAVHISLGMTGPCGPYNLGDFIFASLDYIRVLYFDGDEERSPHHKTAPIRFAPPKLVPFVRKALELVQGKFEVPVPFLANHSPNGRMCYRLFQRYPQLARAAGAMWVDTFYDGPPCDVLRQRTAAAWRKYVQAPLPRDLMDYVNGTKGYPPGPDLNEVSGAPPPLCATEMGVAPSSVGLSWIGVR